MKFILKSDCVFLAENIDDAFEQLIKYFTNCLEDKDESIFIEGEISIEPLNNYD